MEKALLARGAKIEELKIDEFARANKVRFPGNEIRLCRGVSYHPVLLAQKVMHCVTNKIGTYFPTAVLESKLVMDLQITDPIFKFANHYISYCNRIDPVKELPKITSEDDLNKLADSADYIPNHKFLLMFSKLIHEGKFELARGVLTFVQRALPKRNLSETILKHARIDCFMDKEDLLILLALASDELLDRFADRIKTVTLKHSCDFTGLEFVKALCRGKFDEYKEEFTLEFGKRSFVVSLSELLEAAHVVVAELRNIFEVGAGS